VEIIRLTSLVLRYYAPAELSFSSGEATVTEAATVCQGSRGVIDESFVGDEESRPG
jgi:hypothetical protein